MDDDALLVALICRALGRRGFTTLAATTPARAVELAASTPISLLVTDLALPGMNGPELAARIRQIRSGAPVILMSDPGGIETSAVADPMRHLVKPFPLSLLAKAAHALLGGAPQGDLGAEEGGPETGPASADPDEPSRTAGAGPCHRRRALDILEEWRDAERLLDAVTSAGDRERLQDRIRILRDAYQEVFESVLGEDRRPET